MTRTTFKALRPGEVFIFASERDLAFSGLARGPWRKLPHYHYEVGTVNVEVLS